MRLFVDATVDTNRPGFQPLGCGSICTQGFALGWYRSAPLALEAIRRVWIFGECHNFGFSQTDPLPILRQVWEPSPRPGWQTGERRDKPACCRGCKSPTGKEVPNPS